MKPLTKKQLLASVGRRRAFTIYVDKRVFYQFKPIAEKTFGSVSKALEAYMLSEVRNNQRKN